MYYSRSTPQYLEVCRPQLILTVSHSVGCGHCWVWTATAYPSASAPIEISETRDWGGRSEPLADVLAIFRSVILRHIHRTRAASPQKSVGCVAPGLHIVQIKIVFEYRGEMHESEMARWFNPIHCNVASKKTCWARASPPDGSGGNFRRRPRRRAAGQSTNFI
jgi:hypothetical protein